MRTLNSMFLVFEYSARFLALFVHYIRVRYNTLHFISLFVTDLSRLTRCQYSALRISPLPWSGRFQWFNATITNQSTVLFSGVHASRLERLRKCHVHVVHIDVHLLGFVCTRRRPLRQGRAGSTTVVPVWPETAWRGFLRFRLCLCHD